MESRRERDGVMVTQRRYDTDAGVHVYDGPAHEPLAVRRSSWGAVIAGIVVVLVLQLLLSLLGLGVGLTTVDPASGETPTVSTMSTAAAIWWVVLNIIAVFAGGWVAGHLAGMPRRIDGLLHGLITWAAATLLLFYLLTTTIGSALGGMMGALGTVASTAAQAIGVEAEQGGEGGTIAELRQQAQQVLSQGQGQQVGAEQVTQFLERLTSGNVSQQELNAAATDLANRLGIPEEEARQTLQTWQQRFQQAQQQAPQIAEQAAETVAQAAIWSFVALLLGAVAGGIGGMIGTPRDVIRS